MNKKGKLKELESDLEDDGNTSIEKHIPRNLHKDLFLHILSHLPIKPLMLCRCVCRTWRKLISDPMFSNVHLNRFSTNTPNLNLILATHCFTNHEHPEIYYMQEMGNGNMVERFWLPFEMNSMSLVDSCNGLLCFYQMYVQNPMILVWNPLTFEYLVLPQSELATGARINFQLVGFGFHPKSNQYKVLSFRISLDSANSNNWFRIETEVYTLGGQSNTWRRIKDAPFMPSMNHNVLLNGNLHWMIWVGTHTIAEIYSFDIEDEVFGVIPFPSQFFRKGANQHLQLKALDGCLSLVSYPSQEHIEIWVMRSYNVKDSWEKRYVIPIIGFQSVKCVRVVCMLKDGKIIVQVDENKLFCYETANRCVQPLDVPRTRRPFATVAHVETLISPCRLTGGG